MSDDVGLPWAINIAESVPVTLEKPINEAFLFFNDWATGGGGTNADWFQDKPGTRNNAKLKGQTAGFVKVVVR